VYAGTEKYILQVHNNRNSKTITIDASNIISVESFDGDLLITLVLPNNREMSFKAESLQLLVQWVSSLKVAIGKGGCKYLFVCVLFKWWPGINLEFSSLTYNIIGYLGSKSSCPCHSNIVGEATLGAHTSTYEA